MKRHRRQHGVFAMADDGAAAGGAAAGGGSVAGGQGIGNAGGAAAAGEGGAAAAGAAKPDASTLVQAGASAGAAAAGTDWIPEKYRVAKEDGSIDVEASARKVSEAHTALEKRMGTTGLPPASPEEYVPTGLADGFNFDEVKADPMYQEFAKQAHAAGLNDAQMGLVLNAWNERAEQLVGADTSLSVEEAKADLVKTWGDEATFGTNIVKASGAIAVIASKAGVTVDQVNEAGLGRNPTFLRLMAAIGDEFKPDGSTPQGGAMAAADFDSQLAALKATPGYDDARHADHARLMAAKQALYDKRYPPKGK